MSESDRLSRRGFLAGMAGIWLVGLPRQKSAVPVAITIYKSRSCGCCTKWVDHVKAAGFDARVHDEENMDGLKDELGVPQEVRSCHTAVVGGFLIEGHVPAADIRQLLTRRPKVAGLAVPGMPTGTPGMAEPGSRISDFEVLAFQTDGSTTVFARH
jgi:hypothetical protein